MTIADLDIICMPFSVLTLIDYCIIWLSNISCLLGVLDDGSCLFGVLDDGSYRNASCALTLIYTFLLK